MFFRVVRATFQGLLLWPDLLLFGLLSFGLTLAADTLFSPFWRDYLESALTTEVGPPVMPGLFGTAIQQLVLTVGSVVILVAASRVILARLRGYEMSILDGVRLRPFVGSIVTYAALYTVVTTAFSLLFLQLAVSNAALLAPGDVSTAGGEPGGLLMSNLLLMLVLVPITLGWLLANLLVAPVIAYEGKGGFEALGRSVALIRETSGVVVRLLVAVFAAGCMLSMLVAAGVMQSVEFALASQGQAGAGMPLSLPQMQMGLTALLFVVGSLFCSSWYLVATEDDYIQSVDFTRD